VPGPPRARGAAATGEAAALLLAGWPAGLRRKAGEEEGERQSSSLSAGPSFLFSLYCGFHAKQRRVQKKKKQKRNEIRKDKGKGGRTKRLLYMGKGATQRPPQPARRACGREGRQREGVVVL
jgi:hypothetical protein